MDVPTGKYQLQGITLRDMIENYNIYISYYVQFHFYYPCWYWYPTSGVGKGEKIGIISRIENDVWKEMCFTVIIEQISNPFAIFLDFSRSDVSSILY